eukprot:Lithocolla_globosa_v1_NODE_9629_length_685_cov_602.366667.p2 type:complete len:118 gc:universal NODE_9629_length_685_cov_602.366667:284-637(+)
MPCLWKSHKNGKNVSSTLTKEGSFARMIRTSRVARFTLWVSSIFSPRMMPRRRQNMSFALSKLTRKSSLLSTLTSTLGGLFVFWWRALPPLGRKTKRRRRKSFQRNHQRETWHQKRA